MKNRITFALCIIVAMMCLPVLVTADDETTVAVLVDESGQYITGNQAGQIDMDLYQGSPETVLQQTTSAAYDFSSLVGVLRFILSESFKHFVIMFCGVLLFVGCIALSREEVTNII